MIRWIEPPESCNVFTPAILAAALVHTLGNSPDSLWLEPCVGKGAFLKALCDEGVSSDRVTGIDLCKVAELTDEKATVQRGIEFLKWAATATLKFDRIVANPPFIALSCLPQSVQEASSAILGPDGKSIPKSANCWYAFLCAAISLLRPAASLGFVLPASFEFANYAAVLRDRLPALFKEVEVHRSKVPIFDNVEDGSVVLIARKYLQNGGRIHFYKHLNLEKLVTSLNKRQTGVPTRSVIVENDTKGVLLSTVMTIGLGAVTGHAAYFLLTEKARKAHGLPLSVMVPVVSRSVHIECPCLNESVWNALRDADERVWLFRPSATLAKLPRVKEYLALKQDSGGCRRDAYKVKARTPWFRTVVPSRVDGFLSGMVSGGPWLCLNQKDRLKASNTLYVVRFVDHLTKADKEAWALMLLTSQVRRQLDKMYRQYPLGLQKLEPCDLKSLRLPSPKLTKGVSKKFIEATHAFLAGNSAESERIANEAASPS